MSDSLGDRMKTYEKAPKYSLPPRMPIIIRVDGKAFHTLTKGCKKPFDTDLEDAMNVAALKLCEEIQGAQLAFIQSDEISILLHGYKKFASQGWFNNELQKIVSVSAAIASSTLTMESWRFTKESQRRLVYFDSRAFILPEREVNNYFIWRQKDWTRNSVQMLARSLYSHKECHKKNNSELQEMCFQKGVNWNDLPTYQKRGRCAVKTKGWDIDWEIPEFVSNSEYVEELLELEEE